MQTNDAAPVDFDAWNPGLESSIPPRLMAQTTLFRPESSLIDYKTAQEISEFCGLQPADLAFFRPERLVVHELLVRVTADLDVPDGPKYEDLGISLRGMVDTIYRNYVLQHMDDIRAAHLKVGDDAKAWAADELSCLFAPPAPPAPAPAKASFFGKLFGAKPPTDPPSTHKDVTPLTKLEEWGARLGEATDPFEHACLTALVRIVGTIYGKRGRLVGDCDLLSTLTMRMVCNDYGGQKIDEVLNPIFDEAVEQEGYYVLPAQEKPVIMNVKGASAAGKSTIRSEQIKLAEKLQVPWRDFAVVSPDYWRKYLLDYSSLGDDYKYAAMLTGQELVIIDKKMDRYMTDKARRGEMTHLLIDRFRFDSFVLDNDGAADTKLLTRFGDLVFMFFMITPPSETVERAWQRGLKTGRFKAVDDLLYHNVEAYTGIPELFFSWALSKGKRIHYEFLDNDVDYGARPRTVAFGWNDALTILDIKTLLDIDRYRRVNVKASKAEEVFEDDTPNAEAAKFLKRCRELLKSITFADGRNGYVYGKMEAGSWVWRDKTYVESAEIDDVTRTGLKAIGWEDAADIDTADFHPIDLSDEKAYTLGRWAPELAKPAV